MDFLKSIATFIIANILGFGSVQTRVYVAPDIKPSIKTEVVATSTKNDVAQEKNESTNQSNSVKATSTVVKKPKQIVSPKVAPKPEVKPVQEKETLAQKQNVTPVLPPPDFEVINTRARDVIINILCKTKAGSLSPISGTGVVVGQSGLILTNAHIGQYLLLKDYGGKENVECVGRTGSPAYPRYKLEIVFISPTWVNKNKTILKEQNPQGTGENDFAFLRITENIDSSPLPEGFKFIPMNISEIINREEPVLLVSYPAGFLGGISILQDLNITSAIARINEIFTFKQNTIDLISVPGTVVSQKGSSGGAVVDRFITLLGIITTSSDGNTTDKRDLRAITLGYINRAMQEEIGITLEQFIKSDPKEFAKKFQEINAPILMKILTDELNKQ